MFTPILFAMLIMACLVPRLAEGEQPSTTINIGGLRQVQAVLTLSDQEYIIKLRMLPVHCFDVATNARLNREKAKEFALQVLARHLAGKGDVQLEISGTTVDQARNEGKHYVMSLRVPRQGVSVVHQGDSQRGKPKLGATRIALTSDLITRKDDYQHTLAKLSELLMADLHSAERRVDSLKDDDHFFTSVAEIEERGRNEFRLLLVAVQDDILLLNLEKEALAHAVEAAKTRMLQNLRDAVQRRQGKTITKEDSP